MVTTHRLGCWLDKGLQAITRDITRVLLWQHRCMSKSRKCSDDQKKELDHEPFPCHDKVMPPATLMPPATFKILDANYISLGPMGSFLYGNFEFWYVWDSVLLGSMAWNRWPCGDWGWWSLGGQPTMPVKCRRYVGACAYPGPMSLRGLRSGLRVEIVPLLWCASVI